MRSQGGSMTLATVLLIGVVAALGVWGVLKYTEAETNDYNKFVRKAETIEAQLTRAETEIKSLGGLKIQVADLEVKVKDLVVELEKAQQHNQILQKELIQLNHEISKRQPVIRFYGVMPTQEVRPKRRSKADQPPPVPASGQKKPTKQMFEKVKRQLDALSEKALKEPAPTESK